MPHGIRRFTAETDAKLRELWTSDLTLEQIAATLKPMTLSPDEPLYAYMIDNRAMNIGLKMSERPVSSRGRRDDRSSRPTLEED